MTFLQSLFLSLSPKFTQSPCACLGCLSDVHKNNLPFHFSWMDDNSTKSFTKMAQCVVDEYSSFCPLGKGLPCVDGAQTQGENIADNGGSDV